MPPVRLPARGPFRRAARAVVLAVVLAGLAAGRAAPRPAAAPHAVAGAPAHYRALRTADALAGWLRRANPDGPTVSAHRGGPGPGLPENALPTFEHALRYGPVLLECDVRRTADGALVLLHDETLDRTTTGTGRLADRPLAYVRALRLRDPSGAETPYGVPTLAEALTWAEGRGVFTLDPRAEVPRADLVAAVRAAGAENRVVVIAYTPADYAAYVALAPDLNYSVPAGSLAQLTEVLLTPGANPSRMLAFTGTRGVKPDVLAHLHGLGIRAMIGVMGEEEEAAEAIGPTFLRGLYERGVDVVATGAVREALAARASVPAGAALPAGGAYRLRP